jgi:hypothetical protein
VKDLEVSLTQAHTHWGWDPLALKDGGRLRLNGEGVDIVEWVICDGQVAPFFGLRASKKAAAFLLERQWIEVQLIPTKLDFHDYTVLYWVDFAYAEQCRDYKLRAPSRVDPY